MSFIFRKKQENDIRTTDELIQNELRNVWIRLPDPTLQKQLQLARLTERDLAVLQLLKPYSDELLQVTAEAFYSGLEKIPELSALIQEYSTVERLKGTLHAHLGEIFKGKIDEAYFQQRIRIAKAHVHIQLETKWYIGSFSSLFEEFVNFVHQLEMPARVKTDVIIAFNKVLNFEQQLVTEAYDEEILKLREKDLEEKEMIKQTVLGTVEELAAISQETSSAIEQLAHQATTIKSFTEKNFELVVETEESSVSGNQLMTQQTEEMNATTNQMDELTKKMDELREASDQIRSIVSLVTSIADQTNLLALNAAIEAARAGDHGAGFAVVASEVRNLSEETKKAIGNVTGLIQDMDSRTEEMKRSIDAMYRLIHTSANNSMQVSGVFGEIVHSMTGIKQQSEQSNEEIATISNILNELTSAVNMLAKSSDSLIQSVEHM